MEGEALFLLTKTKSRIGILSLIECLSLINCASVDQINNSHAETKHSCRVQSGPGEIGPAASPPINISPDQSLQYKFVLGLIFGLRSHFQSDRAVAAAAAAIIQSNSGDCELSVSGVNKL